MNLIQILGISALCALAFTLCDTLAASWAKQGSNVALLLALVLSPLGYLFFAYLNTRIQLALVSGLVNAFIVIFTTIAGVVFFGETQFTYLQIIGLSSIVIGVCLVL